MAVGVKRDYRSDLRAAQALQTRGAIVAAASGVFTAVGGKLDLLKTALDWAVAGDDQPVALGDRSVIRGLLEEADPVRLLTGWVRLLADIDSRVGPLMRALEA